MKNPKGHRQACRYFANLSFYKIYADSLIENRIVAYMLNDIEKDTNSNDEETIKYSVITLSNLSCHENFMVDANSKKDTA
jgi:hypothetical protein